MRGLLCAVTVMSPACLAEAQDLAVEPGLWQAESRVEAFRVVDGERLALPDVVTSHSRCIAAESPMISPGDLAGAGCEATDVSESAEALSFVLTCRRNGTDFYGSMSAERVQSGQQVETEMRLSGRRPDGSEIQISALSTVRRTGDCP